MLNGHPAVAMVITTEPEQTSSRLSIASARAWLVTGALPAGVDLRVAVDRTTTIRVGPRRGSARS